MLAYIRPHLYFLLSRSPITKMQLICLLSHCILISYSIQLAKTKAKMLYVAFCGKTRKGAVMEKRSLHVIEFWKDLEWNSVEREWFSLLWRKKLGILNRKRAHRKAKETAIVGSFKMKRNTSLPAEGCILSPVRQRIKYLSQVIYGWHSERYGRVRLQTSLVAVFSQMSNEKPRTKLQFNGSFPLQTTLFSLFTEIHLKRKTSLTMLLKEVWWSPQFIVKIFFCLKFQ